MSTSPTVSFFQRTKFRDFWRGERTKKEQKRIMSRRKCFLRCLKNQKGQKRIIKRKTFEKNLRILNAASFSFFYINCFPSKEQAVGRVAEFQKGHRSILFEPSHIDDRLGPVKQ
jgi:hypothetical protein